MTAKHEILKEGTPHWMRSGEKFADTGFAVMEVKIYHPREVLIDCREGYTPNGRYVGKRVMLSLNTKEARELALFLLANTEA